MQPRRTNPLAATESEDTMNSIAPWAEIVPDAPYPMSQEEYEAWPDDGMFELIAGRLVREMTTTREHAILAKRVFKALDAYAEHHGGFEAFHDGTTFKLWLPGESDPQDMVPDASLVLSSRLSTPDEYAAGKHPFDMPPDLAVEIASEHQTPGKMAKKTREYLASGVRLVWNIYPPLRLAHIWQPGDKEPTVLGFADWLDGRDVAPGLSIALRAILTGQ